MVWKRKSELRGPKGDKGATGSPGRGADESSIKLACLGDSMTALKQPGYPSYSVLVAEYLGLALFNPSVAGERTTNIALRQGGYAPQFKVPSGVIPADTTPFPVTLVDTYTSGLNSGSSSFPDIGFFDDMSFLGIPVSITFRDNAWTMARKTADTVPLAVPAEGGWARATKASAWRDAIQVYMGGYNGGDQIRDVGTMSAYLTRPGKFVLLSMARAASGGDSTPFSAEIARWKVAYPTQFYDMSAYVRDNGLADEGITPTTQDKADIAAGNVPASLRRSASDPHYNAAGHRVIARRLAELLLERGMVDKNTGQHIPSRAAGALPPSGLVLSLPSVSASASVAAPAALQASDSVSVRLINLALPEVTSTASYRNLVSRWGSGAASWKFLIGADGTLFFQDANGNGGVSSSNQLPMKNGKISVRLDINRAAGTQAFYTSVDGGVSWDVYGTPKTGRSTTNPIGGLTSRIVIGNNGEASPVAKLDRITILSAAGAVLEDHDFTVTDVEGWAYTGGAAIVLANA